MGYRPKGRVWTAADLTVGALTVQQIMDHLRITDNAEADLLEEYGLAATAAVEKFTNRILIQRECTLHLPSLPVGRCGVVLPGGAVQSIVSMTVSGVAQDVSGLSIIGKSPAIVMPAADWPNVTSGGLPVVVVYVAGYSAIPPDLLAAVRLIAAELESRRATGSEAAISEVPVSAQWLMRPHRIFAS